MGYPVLSEGVAGIGTEGDFDDALRLNLMLRTGNRVLYLVRHFVAGDAEELYRAVSGIPWEEYIRVNEYVTVTSSVDTSTIRDSRYANMKCKDAIVDRIRKFTTVPNPTTCFDMVISLFDLFSGHFLIDNMQGISIA